MYEFSILLLPVIVTRTKQGMYEQHVREVEMSSFTPLVFRGMGVAATTTFRQLASLIAVMAWIKCSFSFLLLRSAVTCLRGVQCHLGSPVTVMALDLAVSEGQVIPSH